MADDASHRVEGVNFATINDVLEDLAYPVTTDEFVAEHGERAIGRTNADPITVRELFEGMGGDEFASADELRQSVLNFMPREAVGRERYSDRGGRTPQELARSDESL